MIDSFEVFLRQQIPEGERFSSVEKQLLQSGAKHVRPQFLLASGRLLGAPEERLVRLAAAVELIHTATLLHDDVVDKADERRGGPSVNAVHGNGIAVLGGDRLFARALVLLADDGSDGQAMKLACHTILGMTDAVALELELHTKSSIAQDDLLAVIYGKTGALFELSGMLAGVAANDPSAGQLLGRVGASIGRIFQLNDDIEDVEEDAENDILTLPQLVGVSATKEVIEKTRQDLLDTLQPFEASESYKEFLALIHKITRLP